MTKAFSYVRFSTPEQLKGDSLRRQLTASEAYAEAHGLELDTSLRDLGVSGFKGAHRTKGALGRFLKRVEDKKIPAGSVLIVEALDRLTREDVVEAHYLFLGIIRAGITVVTLIDGKKYVPGDINVADLIISIIKLGESGSFSENLSKRMKDSAGQKRALARQGIKTQHIHPEWLRWDPDEVYQDLEGKCHKGAYVAIPEQAEAIVWMFELKAKGDGVQKITGWLNDNHRDAAPRGSWTKYYVNKILHWSAVIGEYQMYVMVDGEMVPEGEPIPNHYPRIVEDDLFYEVQAIFHLNDSLPGKGGGVNTSFANVFAHIAKCAVCHHAMVRSNKGYRKNSFLQCSLVQNGIRCGEHRIRYDRFLALFIRVCRGLDPQALSAVGVEKAQEQDRRRKALEGKIGRLESEMDELAESIAQPENASTKRRLEAKLRDREAQQADLQEKLEELDKESQTLTVEQATKRLEGLEDVISELERLEGKGEGDDLRQRLNFQLRQLIKPIYIKSGPQRSEIEVTFQDSGTLYLELDRNDVLREAHTGQMLFSFDEDGKIVDVAEDLDENATAERLARGRRVDRLIAAALKRRHVDPYIVAPSR